MSISFDPADYQASGGGNQKYEERRVAALEQKGAVSDAAAEKLPDTGPNPSTWTYDNAGHLLNVPNGTFTYISTVALNLQRSVRTYQSR